MTDWQKRTMLIDHLVDTGVARRFKCAPDNPAIERVVWDLRIFVAKKVDEKFGFGA